MNTINFAALYTLVTSRGEGWMDALREAWFGPCGIDGDQKSLLEAAVV